MADQEPTNIPPAVAQESDMVATMTKSVPDKRKACSTPEEVQPAKKRALDSANCPSPGLSLAASFAKGPSSNDTLSSKETPSTNETPSSNDTSASNETPPVNNTSACSQTAEILLKGVNEIQRKILNALSEANLQWDKDLRRLVGRIGKEFELPYDVDLIRKALLQAMDDYYAAIDDAVAQLSEGMREVIDGLGKDITCGHCAQIKTCLQSGEEDIVQRIKRLYELIGSQIMLFLQKLEDL